MQTTIPARRQRTIFCTHSLKGWNNITAEGVDSIRELAEELADSVNAYDGLGQAAGMAAVQNESFASSLKSVYPVLEELGKIVLDNLKPALESMIEILKSVLMWFAELPAPVQTTIIAIGAFIAAVTPVAITLGAVTSSIGSVITLLGNLSAAIAPLITILGTLCTWIGGTLVAALGAISAPVWIVIGVIAALVAALVGLYVYWDEVCGFMSEVWQGTCVLVSEGCTWLWEKIKEFGAWIDDTWTEIWDGVKATCEAIWNWLPEEWQEIITDIIDIGQELLRRFIAGCEVIWDWFCYLGKQISDWFYSIGKTIWDWCAETGSAIGQWFYDIGKTIWDFCADILSVIGEFLYNIGKAIWDALTSIGKMLWDWISSTAKSLYNSCMDIGKNIVQGVWKGIQDAASWFYDKLRVQTCPTNGSGLAHAPSRFGWYNAGRDFS
jgi:phage-related minor tail protein